MKKEIDFESYFGEVPASFSARIERTVANLEEEKTVNRRYTYRTALIAAIIAILTIGTALAATSGMDILGFFRDITKNEPTPDAISTIQRELGMVGTPYAVLTVREASYDGSAVRLLMAVEAVEKDKYVPVDEFDAEYTVYDPVTGETAQEYAKRTGREILNIGFVYIECMNATMCSGTEAVKYEGDTMLVYCAWKLAGETPETLEVCVSLNYGSEETGEFFGTDLNFTLDKTAALESAYEVKGENATGVEITKVLRRDTPFTTELLIYYTVPEEQEKTHTLSDRTVYATAKGTFYHAVSDCSGMTGVEETTAKKAEEAGKLPCPLCVGGEEYYATAHGTYYHAVSDCSGMAGAETITAENAKAAGKMPCPTCVGWTEPTEIHWLLSGENFEACYFNAVIRGWNYALYSVEPVEGNPDLSGGVEGGETVAFNPFIRFTAMSGGLPEGELTLEMTVDGGEACTLKLVPAK